MLVHEHVPEGMDLYILGGPRIGRIHKNDEGHITKFAAVVRRKKLPTNEECEFFVDMISFPIPRKPTFENISYCSRCILRFLNSDLGHRWEEMISEMRENRCS